MRAVTILAAFGLSATFASPLPQNGGGAQSCPAEDLTPATWTKLNMDKVLDDFAKNLTAQPTNNVQAFAASLGAPNFFCGLDNFCNAGQPCLPVQLPAWYALVAMQNWNSYMNSLNTAITFASSIISLVLPGIVTDFYPKPQDNVTPIKDAIRMFTTVIGIIPLTGAVSKAGSAFTGGLNLIGSTLKVPTSPDQFLAWSQISSSMADVVQQYQAAVATAVQTTLDAPIGKAGVGIDSFLANGSFLGVHQNITEEDVQSKVIDTFKIRAAALALQAQKYFIYRLNVTKGNCDGTGPGAAYFCTAVGSGALRYSVIQLDKHGNGVIQNDAINTLVNKYNMTQEDVIVGPTKCFDSNGKKQLTDNFGDSLPLDPKTECLFLLPVCDATLDSFGVVSPAGEYKDVCGPQGITF